MHNGSTRGPSSSSLQGLRLLFDQLALHVGQQAHASEPLAGGAGGAIVLAPIAKVDLGEQLRFLPVTAFCSTGLAWNECVILNFNAGTGSKRHC